MNYSIFVYILGWVMTFEAGFMLLPCITAVIYGEKEGFVFLACALVSGVIGRLLTIRKPKNSFYYAKEGFVTVALSWIVLSIVGALPMWLTGAIPNAVDALFEIVSGFTTTGASILTEIESLPKSVLLWRSFSHWIGGMGVLVFLLAILPMAGGQNIHLMKAESPGPSVGKLVPRMRKTALVLYIIYALLTVVEIIFLVAGKMPMFDAICTAVGTAGTGGFGIKNDSIAGYSTYLQVVITVFMMLFGVNFNFYFFMLIRRFKDAFKMEEVKWYFIIYFGAVIAITLNITKDISEAAINFKDAAFQVASVMTTTGFSTVDFDLWPQFSRALMVVVMFIGACAGSTGGGMKVSRIIIYVKSFMKELSAAIHSRNVKVIRLDGKAIDKGVISAAVGFLLAYIMVFLVSFILVTFDGFDLETSFTAIVATINNIGPGLGKVGPACNFAGFSIFSKLVLIFDMLAGRLELFPMLVLMAPQTWKRQ